MSQDTSHFQVKTPVYIVYWVSFRRKNKEFIAKTLMYTKCKIVLCFFKPNIFNSDLKILTSIIWCKNTSSLHYLDLKCFKGKVLNLFFYSKCILLDMIISILNPKTDWHYKELFLILPHDKPGSDRQVRKRLAQPHVPDQGYRNTGRLLLAMLWEGC